jgi:hypothetical protein
MSTIKIKHFLTFKDLAFIGHFLMGRPSPQHRYYLNSTNSRNQE